MLAILACGFVVQTALVYLDSVDLVLSPDGIEGREVFHQHNCQTCHQLWGQGGFLGPDLTNITTRLSDERFTSVLTEGSGQMPAFDVSTKEQAALWAFLSEINRPELGRGQLRLGEDNSSSSPQAAFTEAVLSLKPGSQHEQTLTLFNTTTCSACHYPLQPSPVAAPDLSKVYSEKGEDALREVLINGRPEKGMPKPNPSFTDAQLDGLIDYLKWLEDHRDAVELEMARILDGGSTDWSQLTWWEY